MDVHIITAQRIPNTLHRNSGMWLLVLFLSSFSAVAQVERVEHELNTANNRVFETPDSSRIIAKRAITLAEDIQKDTLAARGYHLLGLVDTMQGNYSLSQQYSLKALAIFEKYELLKRQSGTLSNILPATTAAAGQNTGRTVWL